MTLDPSRFHALADEILRHFLSVLDRDIGDVAEVDIHDDVLIVLLDRGGQYVVNKNEPLTQIWLSSPVSGAWHFIWNETEGAWLSTRHDHVVLGELFASELSQLTGKTVAL